MPGLIIAWRGCVGSSWLKPSCEAFTRLSRDIIGGSESALEMGKWSVEEHPCRVALDCNRMCPGVRWSIAVCSGIR